MSTRKLVAAAVVALASLGGAAFAQSPNLGRNLTEADIAAWDIAVLPDGTGLPAGSGTAAQGAPIYSQKCAMCHGEEGRNSRPGYSQLVGLHRFERVDAPKTVTYYEFATTIFDMIRRSMPYQMPRTLTANEVYSLTAYLLAINKLIGDKDVIDANSLPKVKMPNAGKFIIRFPERI